MSKTRRATRALAPTAFAALVLAPTPALTINGDDVFLLTTSVAPNVILLFDNSDSMAQMEWHPAFDQSVVPAGCAYWDDATQYDATTLPSSDTRCGNTRNLFDPTGPKDPEAYYWGRYLNWYFSDAADPYVTEIETAVVADLGCNKTSEFPDKYRRTRGQAAKETMLTVLCIAEPLDVRFGLANMRDREDVANEDANGGYVGVEIDRANPSHAAELESHIKNTIMGTDAPLGEALFQVYTYYMTRVLGDMPKGADGTTAFPLYQYAKDGDWETLSTKWTDDPLEYPCQKSYVVIVTDGTPDHDDFDVEDTIDEATGFADFTNLIGDYYDDGADGVADVEVPGDADETGWYLDDIASYMQTNDFRTNETLFPGDQVIDTYTVGFATDDATNDFLEKTAELGNGLFFEAKDGEALALALLAALNDIIERSRSFTAATVPSARTADGGAFFNSFFLPSGSSAFWQGHLRAWTIDAAGDVLDANGDCALVDPDAGECNSGVFKPICVGAPNADCAVPFWDAGEEIPSQASRDLKTSLVVSGTPTLVDFDDSLEAVDLDISPFATPPDPAPNSPLYPVQGSSAVNEEGLADEVVYFARGCHFGTGVTSADVSTPTACVERPWLLGDIFHSNPIVITRPRQFILEPSYQAFEAAYDARSRVILAGTNGGWLEAIHAGTYDTNANSYDAGTGAELFGFMPWQVRKTIKEQPIDFPTTRHHYVDGALQAADVWIYPTPTTSAKAANGAEWRTLLVGGLRGGGTQYYALDLTNPDGITGPQGSVLPYPGYQWEFPDENDAAGDLAYMGDTWGTPIITKVRVEVVDDKGPGNAGYERWVAIVTAGYHPESDPNPKEVTGLGAPTYRQDSTQGRAIFMIDLKTGKVLGEQKFEYIADECPAADNADPNVNMCFAMVGSPAVLDLNFDGFADVVYVVDMGGQVFKWVINGLGEDRVNDGSGLRTQPNWPFVRFFRAPVANGKYYKNLFFPPAATLAGGKLWLAFGSGERLHIGYPGDGTDDDPDARDENNRFYVMTDLDPFEQVGLGTLTEGDLTDVSSTEGPSSFNTRGYYFKVPDGEKFVTNVEIFVGDVIAASFTPASTADTCTSRGDATLYAFDVQNGEGQFKDGSDNPMRGIAIGSGLPTDPKISIGVGGTDTRIIIEKSGADFESEEGKDVDVGGRLLYWRER